mgnify:CR=1 FL=1
MGSWSTWLRPDLISAHMEPMGGALMGDCGSKSKLIVESGLHLMGSGPGPGRDQCGPVYFWNRNTMESVPINTK